MKKEKNRTEQLNCDDKDGVLPKAFNTRNLTKRSLFAGRLISFLVFNSILISKKIPGLELYIIVLIPQHIRTSRVKADVSTKAKYRDNIKHWGMRSELAVV